MPDSSVPPNRERGDFIGDDLSGIHTCHAGCPCQNRATGEDCPFSDPIEEAAIRLCKYEGESWLLLTPLEADQYRLKAQVCVGAAKQAEEVANQNQTEALAGVPKKERP